MKYLILIGDGMSGRPLKKLGNKTTLEVAKTPNIDTLLQKGKVGLSQNVPQGMSPGSDIACMSIFGYDPKKHFPGRAPLEAAALGVHLEKNDVAFRCNLVTIENEIMKDFTADHIETNVARKLIRTLDNKLGSKTIRFYPGVSYRHLLVIKNGPLKTKCTPPHDITNQKIYNYLPEGAPGQFLNELMFQSRKVLEKENSAATQIWLWGQGQKPQLEKITDKYNVTGTVITAVDLLKGIGTYAGLDIINVKGATGFIDTNYAAKVNSGLSSLKNQDLLILHIESPDECGHMGDSQLKIKAIEDFDQKVVGKIVTQLKSQQEDFRILVLPDHPTPIELRTHSNEAVPFVFYDSTSETENTLTKYCETSAQKSKLVIPHGHELLERLINARF